MVFSTNALTKEPSLQSVRINPLSDPLKTGRCGPGRCGDVYDFLDVVIDRQGRAFGAFVDLTMGMLAVEWVGLVAHSTTVDLRD